MDSGVDFGGSSLELRLAGTSRYVLWVRWVIWVDFGAFGGPSVQSRMHLEPSSKLSDTLPGTWLLDVGSPIQYPA
jgi:hypothetical protein